MTPEQQAVFDVFCTRGCNVAVDAMPGTGKTATALRCLVEHQWKQPLYLTYNRSARDACLQRLKRMLDIKDGSGDDDGSEDDGGEGGSEDEDDEHVPKKAKRRELPAVHTFHSATLSLFGTTCRDDFDLCRLMRARPQPQVTGIDAVIIDEAQDMRVHYAGIVQLILDTCCTPDVCVLLVGNVPQTIHTYHPAFPATPLFLTHPNDTFINLRPFKHLQLTQTFRLSPASAKAITAMAGVCGHDNVEIVSTQAPDTLATKPFRVVAHGAAYNGVGGRHGNASVVTMITRDSRRHGQTTAVLFNTLRSETVRRVQQQLERAGSHVHLCFSGEAVQQAPLDQPGHVVFLTHCMAKGLEWDHTYVHASHNGMWERHGITHPLPNALFVALTRHRRRCTVFWLDDKEVGPHFASQIDPEYVWCCPSSRVLDIVPGPQQFARHVRQCLTQKNQEQGQKGFRRRRRTTLYIETLCQRMDIGALPPQAWSAELVRAHSDMDKHGRSVTVDSSELQQRTDLAVAALVSLWARPGDNTRTEIQRLVFKACGPSAKQWWNSPKQCPWGAIEAMQALAPRVNTAMRHRLLVKDAVQRFKKARESHVLVAACVRHLCSLPSEAARVLKRMLSNTANRWVDPDHAAHASNIVLAVYRLAKARGDHLVRIDTAAVPLTGTDYKISCRLFRLKNAVAVAFPTLAPGEPAAREACFALYVLTHVLRATEYDQNVDVYGICTSTGLLYTPKPLPSPVNWVEVITHASTRIAPSSSSPPTSSTLTPEYLRQQLMTWQDVV